ncbi:MAG: YggS family pyridoxal phosphate-dependent enzyme [Lachnospiraceae bacterium]
MVAEAYLDIQEKIHAIHENCTLIAVSKYQPQEKIMEAYDVGCRDFGENKVQELVEKYEALPKDIRWHMIGHLQTNKVKYIVDKVSLIHSVDSIKLAKEIQKECEKQNIYLDILLEINIAREESKFGFLEETVIEAVREIASYPNICIRGLMTIPPVAERLDANKEFFVKLKQLSVDIMGEKLDNIKMDMLSMGMSGDYLSAASEGATYVRVGTSIFGARS